MSEKYVICHLCQNQIFNEEQSKLNHLFEHHRDIARPLTLNKNRHSPDPILPTRYRTPLYVDNRLPSGWHRKVTQRQSGAYAGRYEVRIFSPTGKRFRSKNELKTFLTRRVKQCYNLIILISQYGVPMNIQTKRNHQDSIAWCTQPLFTQLTIFCVIFIFLLETVNVHIVSGCLMDKF